MKENDDGTVTLTSEEYETNLTHSSLLGQSWGCDNAAEILRDKAAEYFIAEDDKRAFSFRDAADYLKGKSKQFRDNADKYEKERKQYLTEEKLIYGAED